MKIHALTLNWNGKDRMPKLLRSLIPNVQDIKYQHDVKCTWYIRDNGSKDGSGDMVETWPECSEPKNEVEVKTLMAGHNRDSFAKGMNSLFELANPDDEDLILLLNNDIEFQENAALTKMFELQRKTKADVVGARLVYPAVTDFKLQHAGVIFSKRYNLLPYHFRPGEPVDSTARKNRYFQAVTAALCLVKASAFRKIGGMDEGYKWAFEDIDMCLSIGQFGKIAYCGETEVFHEESASLKKNPVNKMFVGKNVERFRKKWSGKYEIDHDMYLGNKDYKVIK